MTFPAKKNTMPIRFEEMENAGKAMSKCKWILLLILLLVVYLLAGAVFPFIRYQDMPDGSRVLNSLEKQMEEYGQGDRAILLETAQEAWEYRIRLLQDAQESIILSTFDMRPGESTSDIAALLLQRAQAGVKVRILVDGFSAQSHMEGKEIFYALSSHPNIEIRMYNPVNLFLPWKSQGRLHDKYLIVDEKAYILGGRNTFDYFIGDYPSDSKSYDREVLIYAGDAESLQETASSLVLIREYFEEIWQSDVCKLFHDREALADKKEVKRQRQLLQERYDMLTAVYPQYFEAFDGFEAGWPVEGIGLLANPTGIYGKEPVVFAGLTALMAEAQNRVVLHSPYAVLNDDMVERLQEVTAAVPDASLMINSVANGDNVFASSDYLYRQKKVLDTGMRLYEYEGGISYHGKSLLIDGDISVIGSYNLDLRSTYMDTELMLVLKSPQLNHELEEYMKSYEEDSRLVLAVDTYEVPEGVTPQEMSLPKKVMYKILGCLMTPFRCLI